MASLQNNLTIFPEPRHERQPLPAHYGRLFCNPPNWECVMLLLICKDIIMIWYYSKIDIYLDIDFF